MTVGGMRYLEPEKENDRNWIKETRITSRDLLAKIGFVSICNDLKIPHLDDLI